MTTPTIGVCGYGRCGSTMMMTLLDAGGVPPVAGSAPGSYELPDVSMIPAFTAVQLAGRAIKLLSSVEYQPLPPADSWQFIWLDRDPHEQAKSALKLMRWTDTLDQMGDVPGWMKDAPPEVHEVWRIERLVSGYNNGRAGMLGKLRQHGPVTVLAFEQVLAQPGRAMRTLAKIIPTLDRRAAAAAVHLRDGTCRPDMALEEALSRL